MEMRKFISILIAFTAMTVNINAQFIVSDPGNTAQGIINAANTAATVQQAIEQVSKLQKTLDMVEKVSSSVRDIRIFKDLIDRQNRLNSNCLTALEDAKKMKLSNLSNVASSVQSVITNNANIISLTSKILTSSLKMNDSERMKMLNNCLQKTREEEAKLSKIRQIISHTQTIDNNFKSMKK